MLVRIYCYNSLKGTKSIKSSVKKKNLTNKKIKQGNVTVYLGEAEIAENEQYRVSWKAVQSNHLDEKRLKEEQPEIYEKYKKSVLSRRFTVKAA